MIRFSFKEAFMPIIIALALGLPFFVVCTGVLAGAIEYVWNFIAATGSLPVMDYPHALAIAAMLAIFFGFFSPRATVRGRK
jgi:hypothetical protein